MKIYDYYLAGHSCFKNTRQSGTGGLQWTDPFNKDLGLKVPNFEADIVTISHDHSDHNNASALRGQPFIISSAGEYDVKGVLIEGIDSYHDESQGESEAEILFTA